MITQVVDDPDGQIVLIPAGFELPDDFSQVKDEAEVVLVGDKLILNPLRSDEDHRHRLSDA